MWARSLTLRALLALGMLVLFYAVALGAAFGLLGLAYLMLTTMRHVNVKLLLLCVAGAGTLLWSLVPRGPRWEPPGPLLTEAEQPRLFALVREVARGMGMAMPAEVYLAPDVNAFVTQRGGFLGFGGKRVLAVGLGLVAVQNVSQLRAVLAHEFGHFKGGETRLSGVIYATRSAMGRTLDNLEKTGAGSVVRKPFEWMLRGYVRLTQAISRQQELAADEWAARLAGASAQVTGLQAVAVHGEGFGLYFQNEVAALFGRGVAPDNVYEGYRQFVLSSAWEHLRPELLEQAQQHRAADPYDSHPPEAQRAAHVRALGLADRPMDETPAYTLLDDVERLEQQASGAMRPEGVTPVRWEETGEHWSPAAVAGADRLQARAPELTPARAATLLQDAQARERLAEAASPALVGYAQPDRARRVEDVLANAVGQYLSAHLAGAGWRWHNMPGERLRVAQGERVVDPSELVRGLLAGTQPPEELARLVAQAGPAAEEPRRLSEEARAQALQRAAEVALAPAEGAAVEMRTHRENFILPGCCIVCLGPPAERVGVRLRPAHGGTPLAFELPACASHREAAAAALSVASYDPMTEEMVLHTPHRDWAELARRCNA